MKKYQITYRRHEKYWGGVLKGKRHIFADSAKHAKRWFKTANPDAFDIVVSEVYSFSA